MTSTKEEILLLTQVKEDKVGDKDNSAKLEEANKYTFFQACGLNTMMMFGTGPFISIPLCLAATNPAGPQAMIGYAIAALGCASDSFVWGEMGSRWPLSGGSFVYLKQLYGREKWGKLAAFLYVWQFFISGPAEIASGFLAISHYLAYIHGDTHSHFATSLPACGLLVLTIFFLYRKVEDIGKGVLFLWGITIFAILFCLIGGFSQFDSNNLKMPDDAFADPKTFIWSLAAACRFGVYDFTGYYDVCQMGGEVKNPRKNIPYSCIITCLVVLVVYFLTYLSVCSFLPWFGEDGFVAAAESDDFYIMGLFAEKLVNRGFAIFFVIIVCITIFGSAFSMIVGMQYLPVAAAEDGVFFSFLATRDPERGGLPKNSLLSLGFLGMCWCFFSLDVVIDAMTVMIILCQFIGQAVGLLVYRTRVMNTQDGGDDEEAWKMPCFPLPAIVQLVVFSFIFLTSENYLISGDAPLLDLCFLFMIVGVILFLIRQRVHKDWPWFEPIEEQKKKIGSARKGTNW